MRKKKVLGVLMTIGLVFVLSSLIVTSACCCCGPNQVKIKEVPIPWQSWDVEGQAVIDIVRLPEDFAEPVVIVREWTTLPQAISLDDLTWDETEAMMMEMKRGWMGMDKEPMAIKPGGELSVDIPVSEGDEAVIVRYTVALASAPDEVVVRVVNEAVLEQATPPVISELWINPDVHNNTGVYVDNFELDLYGVEPSDITRWFWEDRPVDSSTWGGTLWWGGWGTPPDIKKIDGGTEVKWKDADHPIPPCTTVHFGVGLKPGVVPTAVRGYWTRLCK